MGLLTGVLIVLLLFVGLPLVVAEFCAVGRGWNDDAAPPEPKVLPFSRR